MSFLISQIREQKILEADVALESFIEENGITEDHMIQNLIFDKEVYKDEKEVKEYLRDKFIGDEKVIDGESFTVVHIAPSQIDQETLIEIEIRRGVKAIAGKMIPVMTMEEVMFNDKGEINLSSKFDTIDLSEGLPYIIEIARVAEGEHPNYGKLNITQEHLESMERNFKAKVTGVDLSVNEDHKKNEAFGWFKDVFLSFDKQTLYGQINWNPKGTTALSEKEYRYFSPEFRFNYKHPHSGEEHGATLLGGALTNYPFLKMEAITELNNKKSNTGDDMSTQTIDLSVHNTQIVELNGKLSEANAKADASEAKVIELNAKVEKLEADVAAKAKEAVHQKLFDQNKISASQLIALNEGKDMLEVLALNENMNTEASGSDTTGKDVVVELSAKEQAFADSLGLTAEEFKNYNK